jgi:hypothetical protein
MTTAIELHREGRDDELWQMCCGFLSLSIEDFLDIQKRLLLEQLELLGNSRLGEKIMRGARPRTVEEFRRVVPLTIYQDYCPELLEKREDFLPAKPELWAHTSGRSGEYTYKWVPLTHDYALELSKVLYGVGMISCASDWNDTSRIPAKIKLLYSVAPRPYISGTFADVLRMQTPLVYLPPLDEAEDLTFEERIKLGFQQALSQGLDYFFGLSLVLVSVGEKFLETSKDINLRPYLVRPRALYRLGKGLLKSRLAGRQLLPKDIWSLRGIIGSGVDSSVYKERIKKLWGRNPLDLYSCTEGGVIATQTWDYEGMTFVPNLNFLEFIPEDEQLKLQMDRTYIPKTLLLDEVKAGENYEIVITNFYGGALTRYRIGDMVRITSLRDEKLGINIPQMAFERRVDDNIDLVFVHLTEKTIWQAIESTGMAYTDWFAHKKPGDSTLTIFIEPRDGYHIKEQEIARIIYDKITKSNENTRQLIPEEYAAMIDLKVAVSLLPAGSFANYMAVKQAEGADLAHLKPPHINPPDHIISQLLDKTKEITVVTSKETRLSTGEKVKNNKITA